MKRSIILDTNFLMIPSQFKVDIFLEIERLCNFEYELWVIKETLEELENIIKTQKGRDRAAARLALDILKIQKIKIIDYKPKTKTLKNADQLILELALEKGAIVATQDSALKSLLRKKGVPLLVLRQQSRLDFAQ